MQWFALAHSKNDAGLIPRPVGVSAGQLKHTQLDRLTGDFITAMSVNASENRKYMEGQV